VTKLAWWIVNITSGYEQKVKNTLDTTQDLKKIDKTVLVPVLKKKKFHRDKLYFYTEKLFPGYVFFQCADSDLEAIVTTVVNIPGILNMSSIKGIRHVVLPIQDREMDYVFRYICDSKDRTNNALDGLNIIRKKVKIVEGPFCNFEGIVLEAHKAANKETKLKICTNMFNNELSTVVVPISQVELIA
jgi:transcription antitermination factor NusG